MKRKLVIRNEGSERPFDRCGATWAFYMRGCLPNASVTQHDLVQVAQRKRFTAEFTEATEKNYPRVFCLRDLCELRGECFWVAAWSRCATLLLASKV